MKQEIAQISRRWDEYAPSFDENHDTEDLALWSLELEALLSLPAGSEILDVGTGTGFLAQLCARLGHRLTGVDVSESMLELAREKASAQDLSIDYIHFNGERLLFEDNRFDALVNSRLLWTLLEPETTFADWMRVIRPGGRVLSFMRPPKDEPRSTTWSYDEQLEQRLPLKYATVQEILDIFRSVNYSSVTVEYLPEEMSRSELNPWYCIICTK